MAGDDRRPWTFLTNHARVLISISQNPSIRVRDIVSGITERSTQRIVADLEAAGYLSHEKIGRRNHYSISRNEALRHPHGRSVQIGMLLELFSDAGNEPAPRRGPARGTRTSRSTQ